LALIANPNTFPQISVRNTASRVFGGYIYVDIYVVAAPDHNNHRFCRDSSIVLPLKTPPEK
jgi:hypothetical protein